MTMRGEPAYSQAIGLGHLPACLDRFAAAHPRPSSKGRVLIVEDNLLVRHFLSIGLECHGYACETSASAEEATASLLHTDYDLVVTDLCLPDSGGLAYLQGLPERMAHVPIIVLTGYPSVETAVEAVRLAAIDYLIKPVDLDVLLARVAAGIARGRLMHAIGHARDGVEPRHGLPAGREPVKDIVRRFFEEALSRRAFEMLHELIAVDYILHDPQHGELPLGPGEIVRALLQLRDAFPDFAYHIEDLIAEGDMAAVRWLFRGTHLGPYMGHQPSGRAVSATGVSVFRISHGRLQESWAHADDLGLSRQLLH